MNDVEFFKEQRRNASCLKCGFMDTEQRIFGSFMFGIY